MQNYIQDGESLTLPAPRALTSGEGCLAGDIFGVATAAAAIAAPVVLKRRGVWSLAAASADTAAAYTKAYWDNAAFRITTAVASNKLVGVFVTAKTNGQTTASVLLDGVIR